METISDEKDKQVYNSHHDNLTERSINKTWQIVTKLSIVGSK
jgi:hypothetical protein